MGLPLEVSEVATRADMWATGTYMVRRKAGCQGVLRIAIFLSNLLYISCCHLTAIQQEHETKAGTQPHTQSLKPDFSLQ